MEIQEITDKEVGESFLSQCSQKTFLQSWNWGEFQKALGEKVWRFGFFENNELLAVCLVIKIKAKRGSFLFIPHGPVIKLHNFEKKSKILTLLTKKSKETAKKEKCSFIRIAPVWERNEENAKLFGQIGFLQAPIHAHAELSWLLDIKPSEEQLLQKMRKTTRYLIKQGQNNSDLKITKSQNIKDIEIFNELYQTTVKKHHFKPFSLNYLQNEFLSFAKDSQAVVFLASHKNEYLASAIVIYWQGTGFYHQGASKTSKIPAAYFLQWEAIKEAKKRNCIIYNFWGIADVKNEQELKKHPWAGLSLFKQGFGGYERAYLKTQDLPLSWKYWPIRYFELFRKWKRGF